MPKDKEGLVLCIMCSAVKLNGKIKRRQQDARPLSHSARMQCALKIFSLQFLETENVEVCMKTFLRRRKVI